MHREPKIIVYTTPSCVWCRETKKFLKGQKIKFEEKNIKADPNAKLEMILKSEQRAVPVLDIKGSIIIGFNEKEISKALERNKI